MKILMVLTSHNQLGNTGLPAGCWLEEFAAPYFVFRDAGIELTLASPKGGQTPLDPKSDLPENQTPAMARFKKDAPAQKALANTVKLADMKAEDFDTVSIPVGTARCGISRRALRRFALLEAFFRTDIDIRTCSNRWRVPKREALYGVPRRLGNPKWKSWLCCFDPPRPGGGPTLIDKTRIVPKRIEQEQVMFDKPFLTSRRLRVVSAAALGIALAVLGGNAFSAQDKYALRVPNGLAFSDFRGYENWPVVAVSQTEDLLKVMVANPTMIDAYRAGVPGNGKPFPDGSKIAKIEWKPKKSTEAPFSVRVPDTLQDVFLIEKNTKRFPNTKGWAYAAFDYNPASDTFKPDATGVVNCGFACHTGVAAKDYIFTAYGKR